MSTVAKRRAMAKAIARKRAAQPKLYRVPYMTGSGAYTRRRPAARRAAPRRNILPSNLGSTLGGAAGSFVGGPIGGVIGAGLGGLAQGLLKHITGFGDYNVAVNTLMGEGFSPSELINMSKNAVCLRHREYITDIVASADFSVQAFPINPGMEQSFPWLAGVANNFEEYMITGMIYEFKTLSADYTTASSAALGYVAMATQYNALLPDFVDKIHLENYEFSNSAKPSETFIHPIECKRSLNPVSQLYVRSQAVEANADARLYDLGKFQIATGGNSGTGVLGELWCTYEICLFKPKLVEIDDALLSSHWQLNSAANASPLGAAVATYLSGSNLPCVLTATTITWPSHVVNGLFLISYVAWGGSATIDDPTVSATTNCAQETYMKGDTVDYSSVPQNGVAAITYSFSTVVRISGPSAVVTFAGDGTLPTSPTADLWITQLNDDLVG